MARDFQGMVHLMIGTYCVHAGGIDVMETLAVLTALAVGQITVPVSCEAQLGCPVAMMTGGVRLKVANMSRRPQTRIRLVPLMPGVNIVDEVLTMAMAVPAVEVERRVISVAIHTGAAIPRCEAESGIHPPVVVSIPVAAAMRTHEQVNQES